jgi:hypothetical protein
MQPTAAYFAGATRDSVFADTPSATEASTTAAATQGLAFEHRGLRGEDAARIEVPAGATVVRSPVTPGETVTLPFDSGAVILAKLGDGNLAIKVGDVTVILQGYLDAQSDPDRPVVIKTADGKVLDIALLLAGTDPTIDIETAAGPGQGDAGGQGAANSGALFTPFSTGGGDAVGKGVGAQGDSTGPGGGDNGGVGGSVQVRQIESPTPNQAPDTNPSQASGAEDDPSVAITLTGKDPDGSVDHFDIVSLPGGGTLYLDAALTIPLAAGDTVAAGKDSATIWLKPDANVNGTLTFEIAAVDQQGLADPSPATASVTLTPVNDAPVATADSITVDEGGSTSLLDGGDTTVLINDLDVDGDTLQTALVNGPAHGKLSFNADGTFTYVHDGSETTQDSFTYKDNDGTVDGNTVTVSIKVNPVDDPVSAVTDSDPATSAISENALVGSTVGITASASDADLGTTITYSLSDDAGGRFAIDKTTGVVTLAKALDYETADSHTITVLATSSDGGSSKADFKIDVTDVFLPDTTASLAKLDAASGYVFEGEADGGQLGTYVSGAGDVNGDGYEDILLGADRVNVNAGAAYLVYGGAANLAALDQADGTVDGHIDVASLDGTNGFKFNAASATAHLGAGLSNAGDVNGDGFDDFILGAYNDQSKGAAHLIYGGPGGLEALDKADGKQDGVIDLKNLDAAGGATFHGNVSSGDFGLRVSEAGDVNGDGYDDLIVSAPLAAIGAKSYAGEAFVVFGGPSGVAALDAADGKLDGQVDVAKFDGQAGFRFDGVAPFELSGIGIAAAGDVNGDGYDDLLIGARGAKPDGSSQLGTTYLIYGGADNLTALDKADGLQDGHISLAKVDAAFGMRFNGDVVGDGSGQAVAGGQGDVDGDGIDDILIGRAGFSGTIGGTFLVLTGAASLAALDAADGTTDGSADLGKVDGVTGFRLVGETALMSGSAVTFVGDLNGDGLADMVVGSPLSDVNGGANTGLSYVVFGGLGNLSALDAADGAQDGQIDLTKVDGTTGVQLIGAAAGDGAGFSVAAAGDANGDGFDDLLIGAYNADVNGKGNAGAGYLLFGGNFSGAVTYLGDGGSNTFTGSSKDESFVGGDGDDLLFGGGGLDAFQGGAGNDTVVLGAGTPLWVDGGRGIDTANVDALDPAIDFTGILGARFDSIEKIDLSGPNGNTLILDKTTVFHLVGTNADQVPDNALLVKGDAGDSVTLDGAGWTRIADTVDPVGETGTYATWTNGLATVLVESDVAVQLTAVTAAALAGNLGYVFEGDQGERSGLTVSDAGDVNGDGYDDFMIATHDGVGKVALVFGGDANLSALDAKDGSTDGHIDLSLLDAASGIRIEGLVGGSLSRLALSSGMDINGDGYDDLVFGSLEQDPNGVTDAGASYVVLGGPANLLALDAKDGVDGKIDVGQIGQGAGFILSGANQDAYSGRTVSGAGDVDGDGYDDILVAGGQTSPLGVSYAGSNYLIFGGQGYIDALDGADGSLDGKIRPASLDGVSGFSFDGPAPNAFSSFAVSAAGDVNGDGYADLLFGNPSSGVDGAAYLVFGGRANLAALNAKDGSSDGHISLGALDGTTGFRLDGAASGDSIGMTVAGGGDVNGDGFADVLIGSRFADPGGLNKQGAAYLVFGGAANLAALDAAVGAADGQIGLAQIDGTTGYRFDGGDAGDAAGISLDMAGDVNGDGFADLIIGAFGVAPAGQFYFGASYVIFGGAAHLQALDKADGKLDGNIDLDLVGGADGFRLDGSAFGDRVGASVSAAGDVDGDGFDDLVVGAYYTTVNGGTAAGESYLVFGGNFSGGVTHLGTNGNDTLTGSSKDETFVGGDGKDLIFGGGGLDAFQGGAGNDTIHLDAPTFLRVDGGHGIDTLALNGAGQTLDLAGGLGLRIESVEQIDITGSGDNTLKLDVSAVLAITGDSRHSLTVEADTGDAVAIGTGWTQGADQQIGGATFHSFTQSGATILVNAEATTTQT